MLVNSFPLPLASTGPMPAMTAVMVVPAVWAVAAVGCAALAFVMWRCSARRWWGMLLVASVPALVAMGVAIRVPESPEGDDRATGIARIVPVPGTWAVTDGGSIVPLGRPLVPDPDQSIPDRFENRVIAIGSPDSASNCHGWVFAGGLYWIPTESVDTIIRDNGYEAVEDPAVGDLVVYRDERSRPLHTGTVKAIGDDGFLLVESKWGQCGIFLHTPVDQAFGDRVEYWHADREGHSLRVSQRAAASSMPARAPSKGHTDR